MSLLLLPHNIPDSLKHLSSLVDDIWYYAGDRSTDVSGSYHPRSLSSSTHTFLSPFHHHPHNIRPATSQVTPLSHSPAPDSVPLHVIEITCVLYVYFLSYSSPSQKCKYYDVILEHLIINDPYTIYYCFLYNLIVTLEVFIRQKKNSVIHYISKRKNG